MNDRVNIPDPPAEWSRGVDYREELKLARFSRASYLDEIAISNLDRPEFCRHSVAALRVAPFKLYR